MSPWLSAGTHSPHTPLQPTAVYASADTASTSGAHAHAELLRLPSILRRRDGARVVDVVGAPVVVILGASGASVVVVVVVVGALVVVVVVVVGGLVVVVVVVVFSLFLPGPGSDAHTDGQQHRASTSRAHSRRHVIIIVSVVVQWCGADLHSEGHGEQQGRREVRQTHTEGTPHEERAAATHAPHTAHHAQHTQPCRNNNTQIEEEEANRSGTQGSTACTYGESGPSCRHPSRRAHKNRCSAHSNTKAK
ncbi:hypothetical protein MOQ_000909 [Trypanosoma cruzi marinkellei]|uniref:Uncharacterized protein n=1 Tax=Trypanosoma cruzi marinkellei TaxID=85056 RepID=K2NHL1_TRYCR|nr:hypothetical protein MOQ_000909 [Trypanosoma cruzi marinkellei]